MNVMQLIVHEPLLAISFPSNANYFLILVTDIVNFKIIPTDWFINLIVDMEEQDEEEDQLGYSEGSILKNMGSKLVLLLMAVVLILLLLALRKLLLCTAL